MELFNIKKNNQGQALIEILIGLSISGILIGSAAMAVSVTLRSSANSKYYQTASSLNQKLIGDIKIVAEADWHNIYDKNKGTEDKYHIKSNGSQLNIIVGSTSTIIDGVDYTQSFLINNVSRYNGNISDEPGSVDDPSTQKIIARTQWTIAGQPTEVILTAYLTRWKNQVSQQSDWSGGSDEIRPAIKEFDNKFATSSNIDFSSIPGKIKISGF